MDDAGPAIRARPTGVHHDADPRGVKQGPCREVGKLAKIFRCSGLRSGPESVSKRLAMPDATIQTRGKVLETRGAVLYRVELPNGKVILAHLSKGLADAGASFAVGDDLLLELTPFDFDQARILAGTGA